MERRCISRGPGRGRSAVLTGRSYRLCVITHLVWDWNGTLFDDFAITVEATDAAMRAHGFGAVTAVTYRLRYRRPIRDFYADLAGAVD